MAKQLSDLPAIMEDYANRIVSNQLALQRSIGVHVFTNVVNDTPVDTGRAISNWQAGERVFFSRREAYDPGRHGSTRGENISTALDNNIPIIDSHMGGDLIISNSLSYINDLNDGTSSQAPAMFVETSALAAVQEAVSGFSILAQVRENINFGGV